MKKPKEVKRCWGWINENPCLKNTTNKEGLCNDCKQRKAAR